jgi:hypothetical protein
MSGEKKKKRKPTAIQKRANNPAALSRFSPAKLWRRLPLTFPRIPDVPPSPKPRYRSHYRYLGPGPLRSAHALDDLSAFDISLLLWDYSTLEPLLAVHIYRPSARGRIPFHPVSMYLLVLCRRERNLSRPETLRQLRNEKEGCELRHRLGFADELPSESGLRYFEKQITPELQQEINALQIETLYQAALLPTTAEKEMRVPLSFDGMLHQARSRMRCAYVQHCCYRPAPRSCRAREKGKRGCDCSQSDCTERCRYTTPRDPEARLVVYTGRNKRAKESPNTPREDNQKKRSRGRAVYGYYSFAGQMLNDELATYWILPAAFGSAVTADRSLFPTNFTYLTSRFPWLKISEVLADAGIGEQNCLDLIWEAKALRMVDIRAHKSDRDTESQLTRGYDENGYPFCPFHYTLRSNGHDYQRRRTKWRCSKRCRHDSERPLPGCDYLKPKYKHGYTITVDRTHIDGTVRLAREIPYGSPAWKKRYSRRNSAESRNSALQRIGLKRLPVHGSSLAHLMVLLGDFIANQRTLVRLVREASLLRPSQP